MRLYDPLLYPIALIYGGVVKVRNRLFDMGAKKSYGFSIPTIVVGNLSYGGTGKTPMVEFLIDQLKKNYKIASLSRGYGRKTKGFLLANKTSGPQEIGDESFQVFSKYGNNVAVAVGEKRVLAIPQILRDAPDTEMILLDDAFQHRYLKADFYILLTTFQNPFFKDKIIPLGTLREDRKGAARANVIVVTKCPQNLGEKIKQSYIEEIKKYAAAGCAILFSNLQYGDPYPVLKRVKDLGKKVILMTGIADNRVMIHAVSEEYDLLETLSFADHHQYTLKDMDLLKNKIQSHPDAVVLTTEKDMTKLKDPAFSEYLKEIPIFALPIKVKFAKEDSNFLFMQIKKTIQDKGYIREI